MTGPARIERSSAEKKDQNVITVNAKARRVTTASASIGKGGQRGKEAMNPKPSPTPHPLRPSSIARPAPKILSPPSQPSENSVPIQPQASCPPNMPPQSTCIPLPHLPIGTIFQPHNSAVFEIKLPALIRLRLTPAWKALLSQIRHTCPTTAIILLSPILACRPPSRGHSYPSPTISISMTILAELLQIIEQRNYVSALPWIHGIFVQEA